MRTSYTYVSEAYISSPSPPQAMCAMLDLSLAVDGVVDSITLNSQYVHVHAPFGCWRNFLAPLSLPTTARVPHLIRDWDTTRIFLQEIAAPNLHERLRAHEHRHWRRVRSS